MGCLYGICLAYGRRSGAGSTGTLPIGGRVIELTEGVRAFETWIRAGDGTIGNRVRYPDAFRSSDPKPAQPEFWIPRR